MVAQVLCRLAPVANGVRMPVFLRYGGGLNCFVRGLKRSDACRQRLEFVEDPCSSCFVLGGKVSHVLQRLFVEPLERIT